MNLFANSIFTEGITGVLIKRENLDTDMYTREKMSISNQGERFGTGSSLTVLIRNQPGGYLDLRLPAFRTVKH